MNDSDEETVQRPLLITLAGSIWYVACGLCVLFGAYFALTCPWWNLKLIGYSLTFMALTAGRLCFLCGSYILAGKFEDVSKAFITSLSISALSLYMGIGGVTEHFNPNLPANFVLPTVFWFLIAISVGNLFLLSAVFLFVSRKQYLRWRWAESRTPQTSGEFVEVTDQEQKDTSTPS